jgi:hypothetical protein
MRPDPGLENLLDLNGSIIHREDGCWMKFDAWQVEPTKDVPHGIRYALTLHNAKGDRLMGYDNSHAVKPPKKFKYAGQRLAYDHKHRHASDKGVPYEFKDAAELLNDFFAEVDRVIEESKR